MRRGDDHAPTAPPRTGRIAVPSPAAPREDAALEDPMTSRAAVRLSACAFLALAAACATSSKVLQDDLANPGGLRAPTLGAVTFRFDEWANAEPYDVQKARECEAEWATTIGEAFAKRAGRRFPGGGELAKVDIAIVDLDAGSKTARYFVGFGAGAGMIVADVAVAGHGSFRITSKVTGGWFGGSFKTALRKLGDDIADHLAERASR
jgi:hypothetical protein